MNMQQFSAEFQAFINQFATNKGNQLQYSNAFMPKRVEIITIDLTSARTAANPLVISAPFKAVHVEDIFTTATGVSIAGTVQMSFDYQDIANISNAKTLYPNDAFVLDTECAKAFITNTAQSGVSVRLALMTDIEYKSGSTKTAIVGTVTVAGTVAVSSLTTSKAAPLFVQPSLPVATVQKACNGAAGSFSYTCPAGKVALVSCAVEQQTAGTAAIVTLNTLNVLYSQAINTPKQQSGIWMVAGDVLAGTTSGAANFAMAQITEYTLV